MPVLRWLRRARRAARQAHPRAPRQGRLLGQRDQVGAGARASTIIPVFTRKLQTDVSYLACAKRLLIADPKHSIRSSPLTTPIRSRPSAIVAGGARVRISAPARHGRGALRADRRRSASSTSRAASMRRSAATRICSPISCGACSRTAPTRRSSIGWPTTKRRSPRSSPIRSRSPRRVQVAAASAHSRCRATSSCPAQEQRGLRAHASRHVCVALSQRSRRHRRRLRRPGRSSMVQTAGGEAPRSVTSPARPARSHRHGREATPRSIDARAASARASRARAGIGTAAGERAAILERAADLFERIARDSWRCSFARPARRSTMRMAEVREAVDFLRYYASRRAGSSSGRPSSARADRRAQHADAAGAAASSPASARGIFRSRFSPARSRPRSRPAMR